VLGLVDGKLRAVWQPDRGQQSPALIGDIPRYLGSPGPQFSEGGLDVIAHEVELVMALTLGWMNSELCWGRAKISQPPPASAEDMPSTSAKNARTFSASGENTMACIPVITSRS
jgi:hypothetical protein